MAKHGLLYLLERSAELLERSAEEIRIAHTIGGRWTRDDEHGAKRDFKELRDMAKGLRKAHKYHKPNCLGGPAKMFDAIADRIRAGEKMKAVMADYELKFKRHNAKLEPHLVDGGWVSFDVAEPQGFEVVQQYLGAAVMEHSNPPEWAFPTARWRGEKDSAATHWRYVDAPNA